jgi:5-methylcytosine-specific restriction enzyme subunit McrC
VTRPTVRLVERRTREVRLPGREVAFLLTHARHLVDAVPAFRRGRYRLTPREHVGWFDGAIFRYAIRPKLPWPNVRMLLGLGPGDPTTADPDADLLDLLTREFADRLREVVRVGLVPGYHDRDTDGAFLRGKLRPADQLRDAAARAFPDRFFVTESVLDLDTPWNRVVRAVGDRLLSAPGLAGPVRTCLADALVPLEAVAATAADADFAAADAEPRAAHYRPLLAVCRLLHDGLSAARLADAGGGAFLVDLSRAFERYLAEALTAALAARPGWAVEVHPRFPVGPTDLQPDILVRRRGEPWAVLDAKWKAAGRAPDAADLHQVLAYAAVTGARHVGLVYPGRRSGRRTDPAPGGVAVSRFRLRVVGTTSECDRAARAFARVVRCAGRAGPAGSA